MPGTPTVTAATCAARPLRQALSRVQRELLDHRVREQVRGELGDRLERRLIGRAADFDLEPLALPHAEHAGVAEAMRGFRDGVPLRIVNFGLEHDVNNDTGHVSSQGRRGTYAHMHLRQGRSVRDETHARPRSVPAQRQLHSAPAWKASATNGRQRNRPAGPGDPTPALRIKEWHVSVETGGSSAAHEVMPPPLASAPAAAAGLPPEAGAPEELIQLLTPEGERVEHPDYPLDISARELQGLYRDLVLVRRMDTEAIALQRQGELGLWASLLGQEAAQIGSGRALGPQDMAFPTYREHGVAWCRGVDPVKLLELFRGVSHGGWDPAEHNFHLYTIVIGSQTLHATGYAMGIQRDGATGDGGEAVIAYFGDGATSQGDVNEAFIWASVFNAPVVFFCQNNQWAISEPLERQSRIPLYQRARGFGFPGVRVDGNDVLACLAVTRAALRAAREGQGPTLIEAFTYRMGAHTTTDDPTRYRLAGDLEAWKLRDPIERVKAYLVRSGAADASFFDEVDAEAARLGAWLREACRAMPDPSPLSAFEHIYAGPHPVVDAERDAYAAYLDSFDDAGHGGPGGPRRRPPGERASAGAARLAAPAASGAAGRPNDHAHPGPGAERGAAPGAGGRSQGPDHGRGRRQARRRLPDHRRAAEGLRREPGRRHAAGRIRHRGHRDRARPARLPAGVRDPVRRLRLPGVQPDRQPAREDAVPLARQRGAARRHPHPVRRRHRRGRAPQRITRGATSPTRPACGWWRAPAARTRSR